MYVSVCLSILLAALSQQVSTEAHRIWPKHRPSFPNNFVDVDEQQHAEGLAGAGGSGTPYAWSIDKVHCAKRAEAF